MATMERSSSGWQIEWRRGLLPLSFLCLLVLYYGFGAPLWVLVAFCSWIPVYYLVYPRYMRNKWRAFEKEFAYRFPKGEYKELLEFYRGQWFLRRFGPRAEMLGKLGLIYSAMEKYREAEHAFERAIDEAHHTQKDKLFFNLGNVKYELGKYEDAEQIYKALRVHSPYRHSARTQLALIDLHRGRRVDQARDFLERERERSTGIVRERIDQALGAG